MNQKLADNQFFSGDREE